MRLTNENYEDDALHLKGKTQSQYNNELWQYVKECEDIEKELNIDLKLVGKILLDGIYVKTYLENGEVNIIYNSGKFNQIDKDEKCLLSFVSPHPIHLYFKDYGKTWALTKEELL